MPGVPWAVRLYKGHGRARLADGNFQQMIVLGLDDATLVGAPRDGPDPAGTLADLRQPDAVIIDEFGWRYLFGRTSRSSRARTLEMNDRRAVIVGICKCNPTFQTFPILYCTLLARPCSSSRRSGKTLSFVLAKAEDGVPPTEVCGRDQGPDRAARP